MQIIGHRGARGAALENTIASVQAGIKAHADMVEIDLRLDNHDDIVLSHDRVLTDVDYTTLEEVLSKIKNTFPLNIELKEDAVAYKLKELLHDYKGQIVISSRHMGALRIAHTELPKAELAVIERWSIVRALYRMHDIGATRLHISNAWVWSGALRALKNRGYSVYVYTVNSINRANQLESWGVDGIFTDYPERFTQPKQPKQRSKSVRKHTSTRTKRAKKT